MAVAFTPTTIIQRTSQFSHDLNVHLDKMDDGEPRSRVFGDEEFVNISCHFKYMTKAERDTLKTFLKTNKGEEITWTINSQDYSGFFQSRFKQSFVGNLYNIIIIYSAKEV